jgi:glycosyltransferase involved in cell wall biosynthesis
MNPTPVHGQHGRKRLRICVVTETYPPEINGVAMTVERFVRELRQRGHQVRLVRPAQRGEVADPACGPAGDAAQLLVRGLSIPRYPELRMGLTSGSALRRFWRDWTPDVVQIATEGPLGWSALSTARRMGLAVCADYRTNFDAYSQHYGIRWLRRPITAYLRLFHNRADLTLAPTAAMKSTLAAIGIRDIEIVGRGVDTQRFDPARRDQALRRSWGAGPGTPVFLYVGRLAAEKNLMLVARAFNAVRARLPGARMVFVGDGPQRASLERDCPGAIFAGMRGGDDLAAHYASADVFLFPSLTETFGNVTIEAMASGLAVLAFDYAAAAQHMRHDISGSLAPFDDADAFVAQAVRLALDPAQIARLRGNARDSACNMGWRALAFRLESVLTGLADLRRANQRLTGSEIPS